LIAPTILYELKNPVGPALLLVNYVEETGYLPRTLLSDLGSENVLVGYIYCFLRSRGNDIRAGERAYRQVTRSKINQKIESFWSFLYTSLISDIRMALLEAMNREWYDVDNDDECQIAQLIACPLIQRELDLYTIMWNECKRIRNQKNNVLPNDKPDMI